jgi:hypothetical protein
MLMAGEQVPRKKVKKPVVDPLRLFQQPTFGARAAEVAGQRTVQAQTGLSFDNPLTRWLGESSKRSPDMARNTVPPSSGGVGFEILTADQLIQRGVKRYRESQPDTIEGVMKQLRRDKSLNLSPDDLDLARSVLWSRQGVLELTPDEGVVNKALSPIAPEKARGTVNAGDVQDVLKRLRSDEGRAQLGLELQGYRVQRAAMSAAAATKKEDQALFDTAAFTPEEFETARSQGLTFVRGKDGSHIPLQDALYEAQRVGMAVNPVAPESEEQQLKREKGTQAQFRRKYMDSHDAQDRMIATEKQAVDDVRKLIGDFLTPVMEKGTPIGWMGLPSVNGGKSFASDIAHGIGGAISTTAAIPVNTINEASVANDAFHEYTLDERAGAGVMVALNLLPGAGELIGKGGGTALKALGTVLKARKAETAIEGLASVIIKAHPNVAWTEAKDLAEQAIKDYRVARTPPPLKWDMAHGSPIPASGAQPAGREIAEHIASLTGGSADDVHQALETAAQAAEHPDAGKTVARQIAEKVAVEGGQSVDDVEKALTEGAHALETMSPKAAEEVAQAVTGGRPQSPGVTRQMEIVKLQRKVWEGGTLTEAEASELKRLVDEAKGVKPEVAPVTKAEDVVPERRLDMPEGPDVAEQGMAYTVLYREGKARASFRTREGAEAFVAKQTAKKDLFDVQYEPKLAIAKYTEDKPGYVPPAPKKVTPPQARSAVAQMRVVELQRKAAGEGLSEVEQGELQGLLDEQRAMIGGNGLGTERNSMAPSPVGVSDTGRIPVPPEPAPKTWNQHVEEVLSKFRNKKDVGPNASYAKVLYDQIENPTGQDLASLSNVFDAEKSGSHAAIAVEMERLKAATKRVVNEGGDPEIGRVGQVGREEPVGPFSSLVRDKESFRAALGAHFDQVPDEQLDQVMAAVHARAKGWAADTGKTADEWYGSRIRGVTSNGAEVDAAAAQGNRAAVKIYNDGTAVVHALSNPDVSSVMHEMAHVFEGDLDEGTRRVVAGAFGHDGAVWTADVKEQFARAFEDYLSRGETPHTGLREVFERFKQWLGSIYEGVVGSPLHGDLHPEVRRTFDRLLDERGMNPPAAVSDTARNAVPPAAKDVVDLDGRLFKLREGDRADWQALMDEHALDRQRLAGLDPEARAVEERVMTAREAGDKARFVHERDVPEVGKKGATPGELRFQGAKEKAERWTLKSNEVLDEKVRGPMDALALRATLENGGVKADELKWTGLGEWLRQRMGTKVHPDEVRQYLRENSLVVREAVKGEGELGPVREAQKALKAAKDELDGWGMGEGRTYTYRGTQIPSWEYSAKVSREVDKAIARGSNVKAMLSWDEVPADLQRAALRVVEADKAVGEANWKARGSGTAAKFSEYREPGGENYRELLMSTPENIVGGQAEIDARQFVKDMRAKYGENYVNKLTAAETRLQDDLFEKQWQAYKAEGGAQEWLKGNFRSGHWSEPNVVVHARVDDRVIGGKSTLFVDELQSDWHQQGRTKGYLGKDGKAIAAGVGPVADGPFSKSWAELGFKNVLRHAAEEGYDQVAISGGEMQAARWAGQEGLKTFYDQTLPNTVNKYLKRWGVKLEPGQVNGKAVWVAPVTEEMRTSVLEDGQLLFQEAKEAAKDKVMNAPAYLGGPTVDKNWVQKQAEIVHGGYVALGTPLDHLRQVGEKGSKQRLAGRLIASEMEKQVNYTGAHTVRLERMMSEAITEEYGKLFRVMPIAKAELSDMAVKLIEGRVKDLTPAQAKVHGVVAKILDGLLEEAAALGKWVDDIVGDSPPESLINKRVAWKVNERLAGVGKTAGEEMVGRVKAVSQEGIEITEASGHTTFLKVGERYSRPSLVESDRFFPQRIKEEIWDEIKNEKGPHYDYILENAEHLLKVDTEKARQVVKEWTEPSQVSYAVVGGPARIERPRLPFKLPTEFYETDYYDIMGGHIQEAVKSIEFARIWGHDGERLAMQLRKLPGGVEAWKQEIADAMGINHALTPFDQAMRTIASVESTYQCLSKLTAFTTAIKQTGQWAATPSVLGYKAAAQGWLELGMDLKNGGHELARLRQIGIGDDSLAQLMAVEGYSDIARNLADMGLTVTGVKAMDNIGRYQAAISGRIAVSDLIPKLELLPSGGLKQNNAYRALADWFLYSEYDLERLAVTKKMTNSDLLMAYRGGEKTQIRSRPSDINHALFRAYPTMRILTRLQTFNYGQARMVGWMVSEATKGNIVPLARALPAFTAAGLLSGAVVNELVALMTWKEKPKDPDGIAERAVLALTRSGFFGLWGKVTDKPLEAWAKADEGDNDQNFALDSVKSASKFVDPPIFRDIDSIGAGIRFAGKTQNVGAGVDEFFRRSVVLYGRLRKIGEPDYAKEKAQRKAKQLFLERQGYSDGEIAQYLNVWRQLSPPRGASQDYQDYKKYLNELLRAGEKSGKAHELAAEKYGGRPPSMYASQKKKRPVTQEPGSLDMGTDIGP